MIAAKAAAAYRQIGQGFIALADAIDEPSVAGPVSPVAEGPFLRAVPDDALGHCPIHGSAWTIKPAGVSKAGKPYSAFYKCDSRDGDTFCNEKPNPAWASAHPIR